MGTQLLKPGDVYRGAFATNGTSGSTPADSLPTAVVNHNGSDDTTVAVTVSQISSSARYNFNLTVPSGYAAGDFVVVWLTAVVGGITNVSPIASFRLTGFIGTDGKALLSNNSMGAVSFNNTGQVALLPGLAGAAGVAVNYNSIPVGVALEARTAETTVLPFTISNFDPTGWTTVVFSIKSDPSTQDDPSALLVARVTNGSSGTDGLIVTNGQPATTASWASIAVDTSVPDALTVTVTLSASAMRIPPSVNQSYTYEVTVWAGTVKRIAASGPIDVSQSNLRATASL